MFAAEEMHKQVPSNHYYGYELSHQSPHHCQGWMGACHGEDAVYVFGNPLRHIELYSAEDYQLSVDVVRAWTQFAATGHPGEMGVVEWNEAFSSGSMQLMNLDPKSYRMLSGVFTKACDEFWKSKIFI